MSSFSWAPRWPTSPRSATSARFQPKAIATSDGTPHPHGAWTQTCSSASTSTKDSHSRSAQPRRTSRTRRSLRPRILRSAARTSAALRRPRAPIAFSCTMAPELLTAFLIGVVVRRARSRGLGTHDTAGVRDWNSAALSVTQSRKVCGGIPVISATVDVM